MTFRGTIKKGRVLLDNPGALPDGTVVEVRPVKQARTPDKRGPKKKRPRRSAVERFSLSSAALLASSKRSKPPQTWYDEDHDGLY